MTALPNDMARCAGVGSDAEYECMNCGEPLRAKGHYCSPECRDDFEKRAKSLKRGGFRD